MNTGETDTQGAAERSPAVKTLPARSNRPDCTDRAAAVPRRTALTGLAALLASPSLLRAQQDPYPLSEHRRALGLAEMRNAWDFARAFRANVPQIVYDQIAHGDGTEWTLERNRQAFEWVDLLPGAAVDPGSVNLATKVYDTELELPLMVAPVAAMTTIHSEGEVGMYEGATAAKVPMMVSVAASHPLERIAEAADGTWWLQLYGRAVLEENRAPLERAQAAGARAVVITVDQQAAFHPRSQRNRHLGGRARRPGGGRPPAAESGPAAYRVRTGRYWYNWSWVDAVRKFIKVPVLIKGIATAEDARICVERGLGIVVSNHGGRSLDYGPSSLEALPEIVDAVRGRVPVLVDSGFRRGADVLKALALGANAVCLGRAPCWGLGAFGAAGAQRVLEIIRAELVEAAAKAGCRRLGDVSRKIVKVDLP
jgi:4-hydroxymandelate oxidase